MGVSNGRYVYQKLGYDGYLEYTDNGDWMVTDMMGTNTGYLSHLGGSVCPEHSSSNWDVLRYNETFTQWNHDISLNVKCVQVKTKSYIFTLMHFPASKIHQQSLFRILT